MVFEKLDILESALTKVLDELGELRKARKELEVQLSQARSDTHTTTESLRGREREMDLLREENDQLRRKYAEVRGRVERILSHITEG